MIRAVLVACAALAACRSSVMGGDAGLAEAGATRCCEERSSACDGLCPRDGGDCDSFAQAGDGGPQVSCTWTRGAKALSHRHADWAPSRLGGAVTWEQWYADGGLRLRTDTRGAPSPVFGEPSSETAYYPNGVLALSREAGSARFYRQDGCLVQTERHVDGGAQFDLQAEADCPRLDAGVTFLAPPSGVSRISYVNLHSPRVTVEGPRGQVLELTETRACAGPRCWRYSGPRQREFLVFWGTSGAWALVSNDGPEMHRLCTCKASDSPTRVDVLFDFAHGRVTGGTFRPVTGDWVSTATAGALLHVPSGRVSRAPCLESAVPFPLSGGGEQWVCVGGDVVVVDHGQEQRCSLTAHWTFDSPSSRLTAGMGFGSLSGYRLTSSDGGIDCTALLAPLTFTARP